MSTTDNAMFQTADETDAARVIRDRIEATADAKGFVDLEHDTDAMRRLAEANDLEALNSIARQGLTAAKIDGVLKGEYADPQQDRTLAEMLSDESILDGVRGDAAMAGQPVETGFADALQIENGEANLSSAWRSLWTEYVKNGELNQGTVESLKAAGYFVTAGDPDKLLDDVRSYWSKQLAIPVRRLNEPMRESAVGERGIPYQIDYLIENVYQHVGGQGLLLCKVQEWHPETGLAKVEIIVADHGHGFIDSDGNSISIADAISGRNFDKERGQRHQALGQIASSAEKYQIVEIHKKSSGVEGAFWERDRSGPARAGVLNGSGLDAGVMTRVVFSALVKVKGRQGGRQASNGPAIAASEGDAAQIKSLEVSSPIEANATLEDRIKALIAQNTAEARQELNSLALDSGVDFFNKILVSRDKIENAYTTWDHPEIDQFIGSLTEPTRDALAERSVGSGALKRPALIYVLAKLGTARSFEIALDVMKADKSDLDGKQSRKLFHFFFATVFGHNCSWLGKEEFRRLLTGLTTRQKELLRQMIYTIQPNMRIGSLAVLFPELVAEDRGSVAEYAFEEKKDRFQGFRFQVWDPGNKEMLGPVVARMHEIAEGSGLRSDIPSLSDLRMMLTTDDSRVILARDREGVIVGYSISGLESKNFPSPTPYLRLVVVDQKRSLSGLGSALLRREVADCRILGFDHMSFRRSFNTSNEDFVPGVARSMGWSFQPGERYVDRGRSERRPDSISFPELDYAPGQWGPVVDSSLPGQNKAQIVSQNTGGIDLNASKLDIKSQNANGEIQFRFDPAMLEKLHNAAGLSPVIIYIKPLSTSLPVFLGLTEEPPPDAVSGQLVKG
ncbi:MAG: hypothetical protein HGA80_06870 [Candidatus Omnitrophica bacterium]|nr:hypothetical protein [Candidatus Omnitrophota bacterium]